MSCHSSATSEVEITNLLSKEFDSDHVDPHYTHTFPLNFKRESHNSITNADSFAFTVTVAPCDSQPSLHTYSSTLCDKSVRPNSIWLIYVHSLFDSPIAPRNLTRFKEQNSNLPEVEIDEMLGLVGNIGSKISSNYTMPGWVIFLVEFLLDIGSNVLISDRVRGEFINPETNGERELR